MLDEHRGHCGARLQRRPHLAEHLTWDAAGLATERALRGPPSLGLVEPEAEQRGDHAAPAAATQADRDQLAGFSLLAHEQRVEDPKGASSLDPLERAYSPWRSICCLIEGVARQLSGDRERARGVLEEGAQRGAVAAPAVQTLCLAQLALLTLDDDDLVGADALAGRARAQVERCGMSECPTEASVFAVSALVRATRGRVAEATRDLRHCRRLLDMLTDFLPWYEVEVRAVLARAALRLGEVRWSRGLLAEASRLLDQIPDAPILA